MEAFDQAKQQVQENQLECCDFHSTNYKIIGGFWEKIERFWWSLWHLSQTLFFKYWECCVELRVVLFNGLLIYKKKKKCCVELKLTFAGLPSFFHSSFFWNFAFDRLSMSFQEEVVVRETNWTWRPSMLFCFFIFLFYLFLFFSFLNWW